MRTLERALPRGQMAWEGYESGGSGAPIATRISLGTGPRIAVIAGTHPYEHSSYTAALESFSSLVSNHEGLLQANQFDFYILHPDCSKEDRIRFEQKRFKKDRPSLVVDLHSDPDGAGFCVEGTIAYPFTNPSDKARIRIEDRMRRLEAIASPILSYVEVKGVPVVDFPRFPMRGIGVERSRVRHLSVINLDDPRALQDDHLLWGDPSLMAALHDIPAFTFESYQDEARPHVLALEGLYRTLRAEGCC